MSSLELKIPPDVVWVAVAGLMWLASRVTAGFGAAESLRRPLALILIALGTGLIVAARVALERAGTTWHPTEPGRTTALVTSGVYRFSRNPTYLGMEIVLLCWAVVLASPAAALMSALFVAYIARFQIRPEELTLAVSLGQDYRDYSQRVRRWVWGLTSASLDAASAILVQASERRSCATRWSGSAGRHSRMTRYSGRGGLMSHRRFALVTTAAVLVAAMLRGSCRRASFTVTKPGTYRHSIVDPGRSLARWARWQPRMRLVLWALALTATAALAFAPAHAVARSGSLGTQTMRVESPASPAGAYTATDPATWTDRQLAAQLTFCAVSAASPRAAIRYSRMGIGGVVILGNGARRGIGRDLAAVSRAAPRRIRPFIASDEEGGQVQRLRYVIYPLPSARAMGRWSITKTRSKARDYGTRLRKLGVSVVFGPVADLDVAGHYMGSLDRCFSSSPKVVGLHVVAWSSGLRSVGVIPTVKHWPGHGHATNTHSGAARVPALPALRKRDMLPFERAFEAGVPMVMVGHLQSSGLTEVRTPASLSPTAMRYLRSRAGADTVIITDSLSMGATTRALGIGSSAAAVRALKAGADFALVCAARPEKVISAVESALRSGRLPRRQAEASVRRILRLKERSGLAPRGAGGSSTKPWSAGRADAPL